MGRFRCFGNSYMGRLGNSYMGRFGVSYMGKYVIVVIFYSITYN